MDLEFKKNPSGFYQSFPGGFNIFPRRVAGKFVLENRLSIIESGVYETTEDGLVVSGPTATYDTLREASAAAQSIVDAEPERFAAIAAETERIVQACIATSR